MREGEGQRRTTHHKHPLRIYEVRCNVIAALSTLAPPRAPYTGRHEMVSKLRLRVSWCDFTCLPICPDTRKSVYPRWLLETRSFLPHAHAHQMTPRNLWQPRDGSVFYSNTKRMFGDSWTSGQAYVREILTIARVYGVRILSWVEKQLTMRISSCVKVVLTWIKVGGEFPRPPRLLYPLQPQLVHVDGIGSKKSNRKLGVGWRITINIVGNN